MKNFIQNVIKMLQFLILPALIGVLLSSCGGFASVNSFSHKRTDGKIPVQMNLIREEVIKVLTGTPKEIAKEERLQITELDINNCRSESTDNNKNTDETFNLCMFDKGYLYLQSVNAEQLRSDIEEQFGKAKQKGGNLSTLVPAKPIEEYAVPKSQKEKNLALVEAVKLGNTKLVKALLNGNADADAQDKTSRFALYYAAWNGNNEIVDMLLKAGANSNLATKKDTTTSSGTNIGGRTSLMNASIQGHVDIVKTLIEAGANVNAKHNDGSTALMFAAYDNHTDIVKTLIESKANVNAKHSDGSTALMSAAYNNHADVVSALINGDANLEATDNEGNTALGFAVYESQITIAKILLDANANPNHVRKDGYNIMDSAIHYKHPEIMQLLWSYDAVCLKNCDFVSPCDNKQGHKGVLSTLDIKQKSRRNGTIVMRGIRSFLSKGIDMNDAYLKAFKQCEKWGYNDAELSEATNVHEDNSTIECRSYLEIKSTPVKVVYECYNK